MRSAWTRARWSWRALGVLCVAAASVGTSVGAQQPRLDLGGALLPDGEEARYLRALQALDSASVPGVGLQVMGAGFDREWRRVLAAMPAHPWADRYTDAGQTRVATLLRPDVGVLHQHGLITADVAGAPWAGLGTTATLQLGGSLQWRFLRAQLAPVAYWTQNAPFALTPNGFTGLAGFRDPRYPGEIDLPQRFGPDAFGRLDWGDSFLEASAFGAAVGFSNARQRWGPAQRYPLAMGPSSGGFAHGYVGTSRPVNVGLGRVHARLLLGRVEQSDFSPVQSGERARFVSAFVGTFSPRGISSLEVGALRLTNGPWPEGGAGWREARLAFEGIINDNVSDLNLNRNNGFAAVFLRVAPAGTGLEGYVELSREDFAGNVRWLIMEPDDMAQLTMGLGHSWRRADGRLRRFAVELTNGEIAHTERAARTLRQPIPPYVHFGTVQGLTNRGQLFGSLATYAGAGAFASLDVYGPRGRSSIGVERITVLDWTAPLGPIGGLRDPEVRYALRLDVLRFVGRRDFGVTFAPSYTMNRALQPGRDRWATELGLRWRGW